jgi:tetratricopeptide (TPR) repeat protein
MYFKMFGLLLLMLFFTLPVFCQDYLLHENELDILVNDTTKVKLLIDLGHHYCSKDNQKAIYYLQEALVLSNKLNYHSGIIQSYLWQGRVYYYKDEYDLAETYLEKAKILLEKHQDIEGMILYYFASASIDNLTGDYLSAFRNNRELVSLSKLASDDLMLSAGLHGMGSIHIRQNEPEKALPYLKESLNVKARIDDPGGEANVITSTGDAYELMGKFDSAMYYYNKAFEIRKPRGDIRRIANSEVSIGNLLIKMQQYNEAIAALKSASNSYVVLDEKTGLCNTNLYLALALNYAGQNTQAMNLAEESLAIATALQNPSLQGQCYKIMAEMADFNKHFEKAYKWILLHKAIEDSLILANKQETLQEMETKYLVQQKNNTINLLESDNEIKGKNILILSISIAALALIVVLLVILFRVKHLSLSRQQQVFEQEKIIRGQEEALVQKENQILQEKLETQSRQLAAKALEMLRINETISNVLSKLEMLVQAHDIQPEVAPRIKSIVTELENQSHNNTWKEFDKIFKNIHTEFYQNLLGKCPDLSAAEIKIAALLKLNLSTKEMAAISYKSEEGIKSTRYRLRKKLGLTSDDNLVAFLMKM